MPRALPSLVLSCLLATVATAGCAMDEEAYARSYADEACALYEECGYLQSFGGTVEACVEGIEGSTLNYVLPDEPGDCTFDNKSAKQCVAEIRQSNCDDIGTSNGDANPCDQVCG